MLPQHDEKLPGLGAIASVIRWLIEAISTIAEPLLIAAIVVMIASDVSGGAFIRDSGFLQAVYSWGQSIGIEGQMVAIAIRARKAFMDGKPGLGIFLTLLVALLAGVTFLGVGLANDQATFGRSVEASLASLGITQASWVWVRAGILTIVAVTGAYLLYVPRRQLTAAEVAAEQEQLRLQAALENTRAEIAAEGRKRGINGLKDLAKVALGREDEAPPEDAPAPAEDLDEAPEDDQEAPAAPKRQRKKRAGKVIALRGTRLTPDQIKAKIRKLLEEDINMSSNEIARRAGISTSTVSKYKDAIKAEVMAASERTA